MKTLIAEDDMTSRLLMQKILEPYGPYHCVEDGREAVEAVRIALGKGAPYDLICLDIMMPRMDGQTALVHIRELEDTELHEQAPRAKVIMTTALADRSNVIKACQHHCDHYLIKPIDKAKLIDKLSQLGLIPDKEEAGANADPHR
ncbi:MAG: response regulator [Candidatus Hydrogenedentota bacterium]